MTFAESDWEQESDYARFVLEPPSAEDLRHKADLDRRREKEDGPDDHTTGRADALAGRRDEDRYDASLAYRDGWKSGEQERWLNG